MHPSVNRACFQGQFTSNFFVEEEAKTLILPQHLMFLEQSNIFIKFIKLVTVNI